MEAKFLSVGIRFDT